jgi:predicted small secreted protein
MQRNAIRTAVVLLGLAALAGCESFSGIGGDERDRVEAPPAIDRRETQAQAMVFFLELVQRMVLASTAEQAEIFANIKRDHDTTGTPAARLRYALVLATPNHPSSDPASAQKLLRQVVAAPEALTPVESAVAFLELAQIDKQLALAAETQRLQTVGDRADRDRIAALQRRINAEVEENARLRKALEDARAKLEAIADIERRSTQRTPPNTGRTP